jgi:hypothetical protein
VVSIAWEFSVFETPSSLLVSLGAHTIPASLLGMSVGTLAANRFAETAEAVFFLSQ